MPVLGDIKDAGIVQDFVRWGNCWHGLARAGTLTLPNAETKSIAQPSGDVFALKVPGFPPLNLTPAQVSAEAAKGREWHDYALLCGQDHRLYGLALGNSKWIWARSPTEKWLIEPTLNVVTIQDFRSPTYGSASMALTLKLTEFGRFDQDISGRLLHTFTIIQPLAGVWCTIDTDLLTTFPTYSYPVIADISSDGSKVIFCLPRPGYSYRDGAYGFVELRLTGTESGTITPLADCNACNPTNSLFLAGLTNIPIWHWYNAANKVEQVSLFASGVYSLDGQTVGIAVDGAVRSAFHTRSIPDPVPTGTWFSDIDGDDDGGKFHFSSGFPHELDASIVSYSVVNIRHWQFLFWEYDYYSGQPKISGETGALAMLKPVIYSNKTVGLALWIYHVNKNGQVYPWLWTTVLGDTYYGKAVYPGGTQGGLIHTTVFQPQFTASISESTMTVSAMAQGAITVGMLIIGAGVAYGTTVTAFGTGTGGTGTYTISAPYSLGYESMTGTYLDHAYTTYQPVTGELTRNDINPVCYV